MNKVIQIDQILLYYDTIQLFVGLDGVPTRYLCMLYSGDDTDKYIAIKVSNSRLSELLTGNIDLLQAYIAPEIEREYYNIEYGDNSFVITEHLEELSDIMLPEDGAFIIPTTSGKELLEERIQYHHPIIHLGFVDEQNSMNIGVEQLAGLTSKFQDMLHNIYKKVNRIHSKQILATSQLRIFATSQGSFNVHMYINDELDLFGGSSMDPTLEYIQKILDYENEELLTEYLHGIKGYAISHYKNFLKELVESKISIKTAWTTPNIEDPVAMLHVSNEKLQRAYEITQSSIELEQESISMIGFFLKVDSTNGDWKFYNVNEEKEYKGKSTDSNILHGITVRSKDYTIQCVKTAEQQNITDKLTEVYYLSDIKEV